MLALCVGTLESDQDRLPTLGYRGSTGAGQAHLAQSFVHDWLRLVAGPSYSVRLTHSLSVGASLDGTLTTEELMGSGSSITSGTPGGTLASDVGTAAQGTSVDLGLLLGANYRFRNYTFGASVALPPAHLFGNYEASIHALDSTGQGQITTGAGNFTAAPPVRLALGAGGEFPRLRMEIDAFYYLPSDAALQSAMHVATTMVRGSQASMTSSDQTLQVRAGPVFNTSVGGEYFLTRSLTVLGGASTDLTGAPPLSPKASIGSFELTRLQRVSVSAGVGSYNDAGSLLFGLQASFGWGTALAVNPYVLPNEFATVNAQTYGLMFILAGSLNVKAVTGVVRGVQQMVKTKE